MTFYNFFRKGGFILLFALLVFQGAQAQKTLSVKDTASIYSSGRDILTGNRSFVTLLNFLADPSNSESDRKESIGNNIEQPNNIFMSKKAAIEVDIDPDNNTPGKHEASIEDYLASFNSYYHTPIDNSIEFIIKSVSPIMRADNKLPYIKIHYSQLFRGKNSDGKSFNRCYRVADIFFIKKGDGNQWQALINSVKFEDPNAAPDDASKFIPIENGSAGIEPEVRVEKDELYYKSALLKGTNAIAENKYADAYRFLREAEESSKFTADADAQFSKLRTQIKSSVTMETDSFFHSLLKKRAHDIESNHKYEEAKVYYGYARACDLTDKSLAGTMAHLDDKINLQKELDASYDKGLYDQAIISCGAAITNDPSNSDLYLTRAKCYAKLNRDADARADFANAIKCDPGNVNIYLWQGKYYEAKNTSASYDSAYACFIIYVNKSPYRDDPALKPIYAEATYCKGMSLYKKNSFAEATDSLLAAVGQKENYYEALCYLGCCYMERKDYPHAIDYLNKSIEINSKYADAHYWYGKTLRQKDWTKYSDEAIREMEMAITIIDNNKNMNWFLWNSELGDILQRNKKYDDAVKYYTNCINIDPGKNFLYYLYRGECYHQGGYNENAGKDYFAYKTWCDKYGISTDTNPAYKKDMDQLNTGK